MMQIHNNNHQAEQGFSLVELLLYMGLLSVFLVVISTFFVSILDVQSRALSSSELEENSKFISNRLKYELRSAESATNSAELGAASSSIVLIRDSVSYTFSVLDNTLQRASASATVVLHDDDVQLSNFSVVRVGNEGQFDTFIIDYSLTSATQVGGDADQRDYQLTVGMR